MGYWSGSFREIANSHILDVHLTNALIGISAGVDIPIITMVGRQLGCSENVIATYVALVAICRVVADVPSGVLADYVDVRRLISWSVFVLAIGCAIPLVLKPDTLTLGIFGVLSGFSTGVFFLSRHIYVARISKPEHRGIVLSFLAGVLRLSHVLGPVMLGAVAAECKNGRFFFAVPLSAALLAWLCVEVARCRGATHEAETGYESKRLLPTAPVAIVTAAASDSETVPMVPSYESTTVKCSGGCRGCEQSTPVAMPRTQVFSCTSKGGDDSPSWYCSLWSTIVENWFTIWRLGLYIVLYVALRANRKLLLTFAAMRLDFTDSHLAFLLSLSFSFDAVLFPVGGIIMDLCGRRHSMLTAVLAFGVAFALLPLWQTEKWLYVMAAVFGVADALSCGLVMTLIADTAPEKNAGLFFGVMRTVQDMGHVLGALVVSMLIQRVEFTVSCYIWGGVAILAALWASFGVPVIVVNGSSSSSNNNNTENDKSTSGSIP
ncbi:putative integral membrane transport protein, putative,drug resistance protein [Trypanosoma grayi]|uniref:putative integral membrane transport protein, putative,drug resistance protein n=1 Tax=Trypanosoma grayi TaxID=71804 RepID=UPI0004F4132A|nr:putative integral membrane transport protein, putative,drug resistance protein [Trypanosoma grayi]KEG12937.1 putative integral membrane transport protein, putative,drug resistance protein [Trypanosoma grayi]